MRANPGTHRVEVHRACVFWGLINFWLVFDMLFYDMPRRRVCAMCVCGRVRLRACLLHAAFAIPSQPAKERESE